MALDLLPIRKPSTGAAATAVRAAITKVIFAKLYVDCEVAGHELTRRLRQLVEAERIGGTYYRRSDAHSAQQGPCNNNGPLPEEGAVADLADADLLVVVLAGHGSSRTSMVEVAGIEPASFGAEPGLLRAQPAALFSAPAVTQASC